MQKHTKIVCTIGPATETVEMLVALIHAGMNVARLNFSHGNHQEHLLRINAIRQASVITGQPIAIMLDTKGPEIRTGILKDGKIQLLAGNEVIITMDEVVGDENRFSVNYPDLVKDITVGDRILLDDGLIALEVISLHDIDIHCNILNSGELSNRKGVNIPGVSVGLPAVTEKDYADICFGIEQNVDYIAASFIRSSADVLEIRRILEEHHSDIHIISKIENQQGVEHLDEILAVSEGLMVARGDLGVEICAEEVPLVQKEMIKKCNQAGKPVITATQMLDSMMRNPRPTRAEASDVANAIFDGTDAIMLSGETAAGKYPLEAVQTMANIALKTEQALQYGEKDSHFYLKGKHSTTDAISHATCTTAQSLSAAAIITATESGSTARTVSKYRPAAPIIAVTSKEETLRKLVLVWGVIPILGQRVGNTDDMIQESIQRALEQNLISQGDLVVLTAGIPVGTPGTTNLLKVEVVGNIIAKGIGIGNGTIVGTAKVIRSTEDLQMITEGDIMITKFTDAQYIEKMKFVSAVVTEEGGLTSHGAIVALNLGIPIVVGAKDIMKNVTRDEVLTIEVTRGVIYKGHTKVK